MVTSKWLSLHQVEVATKTANLTTNLVREEAAEARGAVVEVPKLLSSKFRQAQEASGVTPRTAMPSELIEANRETNFYYTI